MSKTPAPPPAPTCTVAKESDDLAPQECSGRGFPTCSKTGVDEGAWVAHTAFYQGHDAHADHVNVCIQDHLG